MNAIAPAPPDVTLDDKYARESGRVFLSGTQALVRLLLTQQARDRAAGLNTAGFVSGYRGSPLGMFDMQLGRERRRLEAANVVFQSGVNEDLAATAVWGTQQAPLLPGAKYDGVYAMWYGKGPGVDRSGDPLKHGNRFGVPKHGGVLVVFGDDHPGKSSTIAHQSEQAMVAAGIPVLYPATIQEYLDYGLHGYALSRASGLWVGFKCVNETVEATATVDVDPGRLSIVAPEGAPLPPEGVHARFAFDIGGDEMRLMRFKLPLAQAFVRANRLDRATHDAPRRELGIVTAGKSWLDVVEALAALGLDGERAAELGLRVWKPAMVWPLEPERLAEFARGHRELLVVEEKAAFMEPQVASALYNLPDASRPRLVGKHDEAGRPFLPPDVQLDPLEIALAIGARLRALGLADAALESRLALIERGVAAARGRQGGATPRVPYFCSGCPHNSSTKVPEGSLALAGIGCHTMAIYMNRSTLPPTQMGGEGLNWTGIAPFTRTKHVFQNLGDGTYFHSGLIAVRGAVAAGVNITYKILCNDAVAMTGGQPVEGQLSVAEIAHQLRDERVHRIAIVSDDIGKYGSSAAFPHGTTFHPREELEQVQRELREVTGVSAIVYEQTCAAEKRRRRKRGQFPDPDRRVFVNELVCEGCGDCSVKSNCVSVEPNETEFGRKRKIDQSNCNKDFSCIEGFCPSFVTVEGAKVRRPEARGVAPGLLAALPPPARAPLERDLAVLVTGIGGTGVVTVGAVLGMAAHLDGLAASVFDMTGLAQKGGAVLSHLRIARRDADIAAPRIGILGADVVLGCDLVVAGSADALKTIDPGRTRVVVNTHLVPTAFFQLNPDLDFRDRETLAAIVAAAGEDHVAGVEATTAAQRLLGDTIGTNMFMVGYALQKGLLPVSLGAVERAIELNGAAVAFNRQALALGRLAAHAPEAIAALVAGAGPRPAPRATTLEEIVAIRATFLADYQDEAYAARYRALVERVATAERERAPGRTGLAEAVARCYFKLLAYKDEYEVARLHSGAHFRELLAATFAGDYRLKFHLAPPLFAKRDPVTGEPRKREYGPWMLRAFGVLARLKFLRGTAFDPFGRTAERRLERRLVADYESLVDELVGGLAPARHDLAVELARIPEQIRGFGHVKERHLAKAKAREAELLARWRTPASAALERAA